MVEQSSTHRHLDKLLKQPIVEVAAQVLGPDKVRLVGGCVRDILAPQKDKTSPVTDLDMATSLKPDAVQHALTTAGYKVIPTGIQHGTVTLVHDGEHLEITTLRLDVETHGRRAKVAFTDNWVADAARRDLSFNAISLDMKGQLHDAFAGQEDLKQGRVQFVGDAAQRIDEDHLRLLRYFRFWGRFGRARPSPTLAATLANKTSLLTKLSAERITKEILGILVTPKASETLSLMDKLGVLAELNIPTFDEQAFQQLVERESTCHMVCPIRRLAALTNLNSDHCETLIQTLALSNKQKQSLRFMVEAQLPDIKSLPQFAYRHGVDATCDLLFFSPHFSVEQVEDLRGRPIPLFPVNGRDLLAMGHAAGRPLGRTLKSLEEAWIASEFQISKDALLRLSKEKS